MTDGNRLDKRQACLDAVRQLDVKGMNPAEALMVAWMDGWNRALDLCIQLEQKLDPPHTVQRPAFRDGAHE